LDNDGDVDIVIKQFGWRPQLLRTMAACNNSVLIKTIGVKSNRDGIGARVKVVSGDLIQTDEVRSGDSYLSQSDLRLHFGCEKRTKIDLIEVRWPSGVIDKIAMSCEQDFNHQRRSGLDRKKDFKSGSR